MVRLKYILSIFSIAAALFNSTTANNITVANASLRELNTTNKYMMVQFDIAWENSWRTSTSVPYNSDAAWIFVKYCVAVANGGDGQWHHASINLTGHTAPTGSTISPTTDSTGAFIYRSADTAGTGTFSKSGVQLRWNYGANGVADDATVDVKIFAIEMVYVPTGAFAIGSGGTETGAFYKYPTTTNTYPISGEGEITVGTATDNLYYPTSTWSGDQLGPIPAAFPKGYAAFYCMKYEISQQGYVDFLNTLTQTQATARKYTMTGTDYRYAITGNTVGSYATANPYVACNFLSWVDLAAYLDWSGLRPMTELEVEKACHGTVAPVPNEYAWGTTGNAGSAYTLNNSGAARESIATNYSTTLGNAASGATTPSGGTINGPVRVGIFSGMSTTTGRVTSGATYYGIMEMSGNVNERIVTVGNTTGREFTGTHGNGSLGLTGEADASTWPGTNAVGAGFRGGDWYGDATNARVSDRGTAASTNYDRGGSIGGRGVRSARYDDLTYDAPMISLAGGTFSANETTPQTVTISSFNIDKYEVTYEKWTSVREWGLVNGYSDLIEGQNGYNPAGANNPVTLVNWYDVVKWCNARSQKDGLTPVYYTDDLQTEVYKTQDVDIINVNVKWTANGYRLPTEAEWEFAAKGGTQSKGYTYSGSNTVDDVAWYNGNSSTTHTVGTRMANELGIYDMSGNVYEWCWDWYSDTYPNVGTTDPHGISTTQTYHVLRGGSFSFGDYFCRSADRSYDYSEYRMKNYGFRCVQK